MRGPCGQKGPTFADVVDVRMQICGDLCDEIGDAFFMHVCSLSPLARNLRDAEQQVHNSEGAK